MTRMMEWLMAKNADPPFVAMASVLSVANIPAGYCEDAVYLQLGINQNLINEIDQTNSFIEWLEINY